MGKLHSSQHSIELLQLANVTTPLQPSIININESVIQEIKNMIGHMTRYNFDNCKF